MSKVNRAKCDICEEEFSLEAEGGKPLLAGGMAGSKKFMKPDEKGELKETFEQVRVDICPTCWEKVLKFVDSIMKK
jgi:hypothetical protein